MKKLILLITLFLCNMAYGTVTNTTDRVSYVGDASDTTFNYAFPTTTDTDLVVTLELISNGDPNLLTITTHYTATVGESGGVVTTSAFPNSITHPLTSSYNIHIQRVTPKTQTLDLTVGGAVNLETLEDSHDKAIKLATEAYQNSLRAIRVPAIEGSFSELSSATARAGAFLFFDANGTPTTSDAGTYTQSDVIETLTANWINTANPWADNEVADDITINLAATVTTNANSTGDVTSVGNATTISAGAVDIAMLSATGTPQANTILYGDNRWGTITGGGGGDVAKVGTPGPNEVGVYTGDGTLGRVATFFYDLATGDFGAGTATPGIINTVDFFSAGNEGLHIKNTNKGTLLVEGNTAGADLIFNDPTEALNNRVYRLYLNDGLLKHQALGDAGGVQHELVAYDVNNGNFGVGSFTFGTASNNTVVIADGTANTSNPANQVSMYSLSGELWAEDSGGTASQLTANTDSFPADMAFDPNFPYVTVKRDKYAGLTTYISEHKLAELIQVWAKANGHLAQNEYIIKHVPMDQSEIRDWDQNELEREAHANAAILKWQQDPNVGPKPKTYTKKPKKSWHK